MSNKDEQEPPFRGALLKQVLELLGQLESVGTERDSAGNRTLLFSHYAGLVLLSLFATSWGMSPQHSSLNIPGSACPPMLSEIDAGT